MRLERINGVEIGLRLIILITRPHSAISSSIIPLPASSPKFRQSFVRLEFDIELQ